MSTPSSTDTRVAAGGRLRIDSRRRWFPDLGPLVRARQIVLLLSRRDITVKYRQTVLGTVWIFAGPLVSAGLFTFVFGRVAKLPSDGVPYFAFSYAGLLGWSAFSSTMTRASTSLTSNSALITKIYFPRLVLPFSTVFSTLIDAAISLGIMLVLLWAYGIGLTLRMLVLPAWLLLAIVLAMGIGLVLTAASVSFRDVNYLTPIFTSLLLYLSPVAYSSSAVPPELRHLYLFNPLTTIVEGCRWSLLGHGTLSPLAIVYTAVLSLGALIVGLALFTRLESNFADVI